jgi:hypothetical protein
MCRCFCFEYFAIEIEYRPYRPRPMCVCLRLHVVWWEVNVHAYDAYTHRGMSATTHSKRAVRVLTFHTAPAKTLLAVACASRHSSHAIQHHAGSTKMTILSVRLDVQVYLLQHHIVNHFSKCYGTAADFRRGDVAVA